MPGEGIYHNTCLKTRIVRSLWSDWEKAFADVLMKAFHKGRVKVFIKVSVLDVLTLDAAEPDRSGSSSGVTSSATSISPRGLSYPPVSSVAARRWSRCWRWSSTTRRRATTADDVKATAARLAAFPVARFSARDRQLTPELVRAKLIAEYRVVRAGTLPEEMG